MRSFEIHFILDGKAFVEQLTTSNSAKARQQLLMRYPNAKITSVREV